MPISDTFKSWMLKYPMHLGTDQASELAIVLRASSVTVDTAYATATNSTNSAGSAYAGEANAVDFGTYWQYSATVDADGAGASNPGLTGKGTFAISVSNGITATKWMLVDSGDSEILAVGDLDTSYSVVSGDTISIDGTAIKIELD